MKHLKEYKKFINENNNDDDEYQFPEDIRDGEDSAEMRDEIQDDEIQDNEIQDEQSEQSEDDCYIVCNGWDYNVSIEGKHIGKFVKIDDAEDAIRNWARKNKWYPSCWFVSDHGNTSPYEIDYQM